MYQKYFKRMLDATLSALAILILSPIMILLALLILISLGRPVIFKQERIGLYERVFTIYKFRTMRMGDNDDDTPLSEEERLTRLGKLLRSLSLDELPSLFNVLKGDMSIIGPRPLLTKYLPYYTESERKRHSIRPGLSGLAQINGRNALGWDERFALDVKYASDITFCGDLKLCIQSVKAVIRRNDILVGSQHVMKNLDDERRGYIDLQKNESLRY